MPDNQIIYEAQDLSLTFGYGSEAIRAVDRVNFSIHSGEIMAIAGESGAGKSTLARLLLGLQRQSQGKLLFRGQAMPRTQELCHQVQAVFQDPFASFNQFHTVKKQLRDTFNLQSSPPSSAEMEERIDQSLEAVSLDPGKMEDKYPFELSGGQIQRLLLSRIALIRPQILVADEPTSMVDACSRTHILDLLMELQHELGMTIIFITHDLGLAHYLCDRIMIMHRGKIVEDAPVAELFGSPAHPYTRQLLANIPRLHTPWLDPGLRPFPLNP